MNGRMNGWMAPACCSAVVLLVTEKTPSPTLDLASTERRNGKANGGMDGWNGWMERERERARVREKDKERDREGEREREKEERDENDETNPKHKICTTTKKKAR